MKLRPVVVQDEQAPVAAEIIAQSIVNISKATQALLNSGLKTETIVTLIHAHSFVGKPAIRTVLATLQDLRTLYTTK